jgi:quinol monooxygenase YgiN
MVHSIVATIKVKAGEEAAFEAIARKLVAAVNTNEPGCMLYTLNKGDQGNDPRTYVFMERYEDEDAVKAHRATDHYRTLGRAMGAHMDGAPTILRMKELA